MRPAPAIGVWPKAADVAIILQEGIFDKDMDWYETPQPTGELIHFTCHYQL
ncbi:uncharacterized protein F5891DRAFT_1188854 [Suillus fuscotomentosus]|uniref:Uncharacterized protein n=1 Tax=Suillus fuscotomentosus TaxID=1912939 RepID=A0AAD4HL45_9AGAM|nr:uncharacterized protein F5891DRAFT_1188854 [Suillus fuscotomentosus]KAG1900161.1 hypothetical protein F5891DRAFT_1188854 [Suillus fuscotomentosus]